MKLISRSYKWENEDSERLNDFSISHIWQRQEPGSKKASWLQAVRLSISLHWEDKRMSVPLWVE
jgi:hypothetical protein